MAGMREPLGTYESSGIVKVGPFLSSIDGKTILTTLVITQADVTLSKNNEDFAQKDDVNVAVSMANGWYNIPLNENDIDTDGQLLMYIKVPDALPVWRKFQVALVVEPPLVPIIMGGNLINNQE